MADTFTIWKQGVLVGLGAPDNAITMDVLWAWSQAEGGLGHNNPLNTTYFMAGAVPWNTLSNGLHVWSYIDIQDGINATVVTLLAPDPSVGLPNGYDVIVSHLRNSVPRQQWGDACWQLDKWGTGCGWINTTYGAAPGDPGEEEDLAKTELVTGDNNDGKVYVTDWMTKRYITDPGALPGWYAILGVQAPRVVPAGVLGEVPEQPSPAAPLVVPTNITLTGKLS